MANLSKEQVEQIFKNTNNDLIKIALQYNSTKLLDPECMHYAEHYDRFFDAYRSTPIKILEIGVQRGDSLRMWRDYFHPDSKIYGMEINEAPLRDFQLSNTKVFIGDQSNLSFLKDVVAETGKFDIIIDDGGHVQNDMKVSFDYLFEHGLTDTGLYIVEDLGCSYWPAWGGGLKNENTFIEFLKERIDDMNFRFWKGNRNTYGYLPPYSSLEVSYFDKNITSIYTCKGLAFIQKGSNVNYEF